MGNLIDSALAVLNAFRSEVSTWTNQGTLTSIDGHIAQIVSAAEQDVHAGETAVKAIFGDLYSAFHGHGQADPVAQPAPETPTPAAASSTPQPSTSSSTEAAPSPSPVAVDPTPAPSTTEASSAPSSTPSTSTTEPPAAPASPAV